MTIEADHAEPPLPPMCDQAEFDKLMVEMVADETPRLFAVVQELGDRSDGWVAAWGLAFDDHVEILREGGLLRLRSPDRALWLFSRPSNLTAHLVWIPPDRAVVDGGEATG